MVRPLRLKLAVLAAVAASPVAAQAPQSLSCAGPFAKTSDEAALRAAFGAQNVSRADLDVGEGQTEPGAVVFAGDPKRRIEIFWHDTEKRRRPSAIRVREGATWALPAPGGERALVVGMPLADVEAINGKPFPIAGFGWDYGGSVGQWRGGRLGALPGGCFLSMRLAPDPKAKDEAIDKVSGDRPILSSSPAMRAVRPFVEEMTLGWPE